MAATKISGLTIDAAPNRANDYAPTYDASAVATKRVALRDFGMMYVTADFAATSPVDATTYYFGSFPSAVLTTTAAVRRLYIPRAGIITGAFFTFVATAGSAETSTLSIRLNNTTDTTITSTLALNASSLAGSNLSLSISVAASDYVEIKWVTPTWVTNPTGVMGRVTLVLE